MVQKNVLAMSGRAVEAAGDVDVLLLDKTGTITLGDRQATEFLPAPGIRVEELADAANLASLADETPEGRSIVVLAKKYGLRGRSISEMPSARFIAFSAQTRMSGVDIDGRQIRKGAPDAVQGFIGKRIPCGGSRYQSTPFPVPAEPHWWSPTDTRVLGVIHLKGHCKGRAQRPFRAIQGHGYQDGDDHGRQPAHGGGHSQRGRCG